MDLLSAIEESRANYWSDPAKYKRGRLTLHETRRAIVGEAFSSLGIENTELSDRVADTFSERRLNYIALFPRAIEALELLRLEGINLGLSRTTILVVRELRSISLAWSAILMLSLSKGKSDSESQMSAFTAVQLKPFKYRLMGYGL